jgi:diguanylate cyclase
MTSPHLRVLLVEDSPLDAALVSEHLRSVSPETVLEHVTGVATAASKLRKARYDCVLLDLSLPDARGLEALGDIHDAAPKIPIVVLSGADDETTALHAVQEGAQDYLVKGEATGQLILRSLRYAIERKRVELRLADAALHDPLTGLPNRDLLLDRTAHALRRQERRSPGLVALLFMDLDRFKNVNDSLGHHAGDRLLVEVGRRLSAVVRPADTVARFGGDEFGVLCEDVLTESDVDQIVGRITHVLSEPMILDGREVIVNASIGIAVANGADVPAEQLLREADAAMYRAKESGRTHERFDDEMRTAALRRLEVEAELHRALRRGELVLHYQPIFSLQNTGEVVGMEALVRWNHPERGLLGPGDFIPTAEDTGLIVPLGAWVLHEAVRQLKRFGRPDLTMSVNVAARQLGDESFADEVRSVLIDTGVAPERLCLEITEGSLMEERWSPDQRLKQLKNLGVRIAVDDFGTGYSALSYLTRFPVDVLKIDRSFVMSMADQPHQKRIVAAVLGMARGMGLEAVAEGVEDTEHADTLAKLGCDRAQGFAFSPPRPAAEIAELLAQPHAATSPRRPSGGAEELRIFVCDDAPELRMLMRSFLDGEPDLLVVGEAGDGHELAGKVRDTGADVILLDLSMPNVDGLEAIVDLRRSIPHLGIVILSGFESERMQAQTLALGADRYVEKRARADVVLDTVREVGRRRRGGSTNLLNGNGKVVSS